MEKQVLENKLIILQFVGNKGPYSTSNELNGIKSWSLLHKLLQIHRQLLN